METKTDNQIIAEFMDGTTFDSDGLCTDTEKKYSWRPGCYDPLRVEHLAYHNNWNWLMPVVEKIATLKHPTYIYISHIQKTCSVYELLKGGSGESNNRMIHNSGVKETAIQLTYKSVVEFIKWYNQQSPNS